MYFHPKLVHKPEVLTHQKSRGTSPQRKQTQKGENSNMESPNHYEQQQLEIVQQKVMFLLAERILEFQKILILNRRKKRQRIRRRLILLRSQYIQRITNVPHEIVKSLPKPVRKVVNAVRPAIAENQSEWWEEIAQKTFNDKKWLENFHVTKPTFQWLCEQLCNDLTPKCHQMRKPVCLEKRVGMALQKLTCGDDYRTMAERYGVARSTCCKFLMMFCRAIQKLLKEKYVKLPDTQEFQEIERNYRKFSSLPHVYGTVVTCHLPLNNTESNTNLSFPDISPFGRANFTLRAVIDHNMQFRRVSVNSEDFFHSVLLNVPDVQRHILNKTINPYLIGQNRTHQLCHPQFMTKYKCAENERCEKFNVSMDKVQDISRKTLKRFNGRFNILNKRSETEHKNMDIVIETCAILYNIFELRNEPYLNEWENDLKNCQFNGDEDSSWPVLEAMLADDALQVRNVLTNYISTLK